MLGRGNTGPGFEACALLLRIILFGWRKTRRGQQDSHMDVMTPGGVGIEFRLVETPGSTRNGAWLVDESPIGIVCFAAVNMGS